MRRLHTSLALKVALLCVVIAGLLGIALTWGGYAVASRGLIEQAEAALGADGQLVVDFIERWDEERTKGLVAIAGIPSLARIAASGGAVTADDAREVRGILEGLAATLPDVDSVALCNTAGTFVASTNPVDLHNQSSNLPNRDYFRRALAGESFTSGITTSTLTDKVALFHSAPLRDDKGRIVGVVRSRAGLAPIIEAVALAHDRVGPGAAGVLLDQDGLVVASSLHPDWVMHPVVPLSAETRSRLIQDMRWGKNAEPPSLDELELGRAVRASERASFTWSSGGVDYFGVAVPLRSLGWTYVVVQPSSTVNRLARQLRGYEIVAISVGLALATATAILFARRVLRPVRQLVQVSERIVGDGDLTQDITVSTRDEVGQLAEAFRELVGKLREIFRALGLSVDSLTEASDALTAAADQQNRMVLRQAAALTETQTTAQELKESALLAAKKADQMLAVAERADELGRSGEKAVEQSLGALEEMRASMAQIVVRAQELEQSRREIGQIAATVGDLAKQSNTLALNAAIEAVRSGEHGRGFAVVAREIRSLADQSVQETRRVREVLDKVTVAIAGLARIGELAAPRMESGLSQMRSSGQRLLELAGIVNQNSGAARQITAAVREQTEAIGQIFGAVTDQMTMMDETRQRLGETSEAAEKLKELSRTIATIVRGYRA